MNKYGCYELDYKMCYISILQIISEKKNKISLSDLEKLYYEKDINYLKKKKDNLYNVCLFKKSNCFQDNIILRDILFDLQKHSCIKDETLKYALANICFEMQIENFNYLTKHYRNQIDFCVFADQICLKNFKILNEVKNIMAINSLKVLKRYNNNSITGLIVSIKKSDYSFNARKNMCIINPIKSKSLSDMPLIFGPNTKITEN